MSVKVFFCYAHEDEPLLKRLKKQLTPMQQQGDIEIWHDRDISAGTEWEQEISEQLNTAQIILLLVSPDFMASDYCISIEMKRALERHHRKEARVIPVILRPVYWQKVLGYILALPTDAKPIMSSSWPSPDDAFFDVAQGIRKVVMQLTPPHAFASPAVPGEIQPEIAKPSGSTPAVQLVDTVSPFLSPLAIDKLALLRTLTGHTSFVSSVAISADRQTLVSGSFDNTIKVWNLSTGKKVRTLTGHISYIYSVAISADGQTLASGSHDETIKVWNLSTGQAVRTLTGHTEEVSSIAISADGQTLASGSFDRTIKVWSLSTGKRMDTLTGHTDGVTSVAISADGQTLVSGSWDGTIKVWNLSTGEEARTLEDHTSSVESVAISADGQTLVSGSGDNTIKVWGA